MSKPCDLTAVEARALIGRKALSPVELLESCLQRIAEVDPAVNAIVALDEEAAWKSAREAEGEVMSGATLGPLHGLPLGVKDATLTAGLRTTFGSPLFRDYVPTQDEAVIGRLRAQGGIVLCKTNTPEWSAGGNTRNPVYGATGNPFDPTMSAAGSSGGSAVALATGMTPLATGTDVGGSLRNPAAFCGIVGMRPSPGLIPSDTRLLGWSGMSALGPMARNVTDLGLLLSAMVSNHSYDPQASTTAGRGMPHIRDYHPIRHADLSRVRVAFTPNFRLAPTERHIRGVFAEKTGLFRHIFASATDDTPDCSGAHEAFAVLRAVDFLANHLPRVRKTPDMVGPNIRWDVNAGLNYTTADVAAAEAARTRIYRCWQAFFDSYDIIITPTVTISPRPWPEFFPTEIDGEPTRSYFHWLMLAYVVTLTGHPAISLPVGLDNNGMPFGLQIIGPRGGDAYLLSVAAALEAALADDPRTARPVPDLGRLKTAQPIRDMPGFFDQG